MPDRYPFFTFIALMVSLLALSAEGLDDVSKEGETPETETQTTYEAFNTFAKLGKSGSSQSGWPKGMESYKIRFIRLEHEGLGWDDGMDKSGADRNFLQGFAKATGFDKVATKGESHAIGLLAKYPDDGFPPFVFLTGNGNMGRVRANDAKVLRDYCFKGGMLIADAGSARFHHSFVHFMNQVFPDKPLIDIGDDDMIFQVPYSFPEGAPAFWHHGGRRALGIRHNERWCVFYHPGDMNDAWKLQGFSDATPEMKESAIKMGVNLLFYSFSHWEWAINQPKKGE